VTGFLALVWLDGLGWAGQAAFTWRVVHQWWASERAGRSVVPRAYWGWSLLGTALLLGYATHRRDPVFFVGALVNGCVFARNLWLSRPGRVPTPRVAGRPGPRLLPVAVGLVIFGVVIVEAIGPEHGLVHFVRSVPWLAVGFVGQTLWIGRFVVQWWASERKGESHLPKAFFEMSIAGAALLFAYAVSQRDWVNMAAYALNPIPYARNLVLLRREAKAARAAAAPEPGRAPAARP
jgi:lipid-A-disaccharide synthase-like uncharacterized protein